MNNEDKEANIIAENAEIELVRFFDLLIKIDRKNKFKLIKDIKINNS